MFSVCMSVHTGGGGYLPSQVWMGGGTWPGLDGGGYLARSGWGGTWIGLDGGEGGVPGQVWMGGRGEGGTWPGLDGGGGRGVLAGGEGEAGTWPGGRGVPGQKECLLCSGRYASCVHAGGLSCS